MNIDSLQLATAEFSRRLGQVEAEQWTAASPCDEWTVRDVCDHVVGGNRFAVLILGGLDWREALSRARAGDFSGDPVAAFDESARDQLVAFEAAGVLDRFVDHPAGPMLGRTFAGNRIVDLVVHGWDVARAVGGDEHLDEGLVAIALEVLGADGAIGAGPSGTVGADDSPGRRLLDLSGRRP